MGAEGGAPCCGSVNGIVWHAQENLIRISAARLVADCGRTLCPTHTLADLLPVCTCDSHHSLHTVLVAVHVQQLQSAASLGVHIQQPQSVTWLMFTYISHNL